MPSLRRRVFTIIKEKYNMKKITRRHIAVILLCAVGFVGFLHFMGGIKTSDELTGQVVVVNNDINFRTRPSGRVITQLHEGCHVELTGRYREPVDGPITRWIECQIPGTDLTGWVASFGIEY